MVGLQFVVWFGFYLKVDIGVPYQKNPSDAGIPFV